MLGGRLGRLGHTGQEGTENEGGIDTWFANHVFLNPATDGAEVCAQVRVGLLSPSR